jgi:hypothetical protein
VAFERFLISLGHTIPFVWNGAVDDLPSTMSGLMDRAMHTHRNRITPNTLSALAALS